MKLYVLEKKEGIPAIRNPSMIGRKQDQKRSCFIHFDRNSSVLPDLDRLRDCECHCIGVTCTGAGAAGFPFTGAAAGGA